MENAIQETIDITYDFRHDSNGRDPDGHSETLRLYHKMLWSKTLPNGELFNLDDSYHIGQRYLYYESNLDNFHLSSDTISHSYRDWKRMEYIIKRVQKEVEEFYFLNCTIGAYIIFPKDKIEGVQTINQARGRSRIINDRFDLTLECIKLHYDRRENPLQETLEAYGSFFKLFKNFNGYCEFFLLQDLVFDDYTKIKFFLPFNGFVSNPLPASIDEYLVYKNNSVEFVRKRNNRIQMFSRNSLILGKTEQ